MSVPNLNPPKGRIITLDSFKPDPEQLAKDKALQDRYDSDPKVRELADDIHHHRMMAGPACLQCIEIAIHRLDKTQSLTASTSSSNPTVDSSTVST